MANHTTNDATRLMCENAKPLGFRPDRLMMLDKRLAEWSKNVMTPSIAVKILRHGQVAFEGAYGISGKDNIPDSLTMDTIFPVASITKPVVATLLAIMQEEGLVDFYHPVREYLPEFTGDPNGLVRVWHLLSHSSGMVDSDMHRLFKEHIMQSLGLDFPSDEDSPEAWDVLNLKIREKMGLPYMEPGAAMRRNTNLVTCLSFPPTRKPQEAMAYCSFGYDVAMEIINRVSGERIDDYAGRKLFSPLGMTDSHFLFPREKLPRFVTRSAEYIGSGWMNEGVLDSESGSGGLKTTVHDMVRFGQMFLNSGKLDGVRILSSASVREMTIDHNAKLGPSHFNGDMFDSNWGLGWNIKASKKDDSGILRSARAYDHSGFGCCKLTCDPDADIAAAFFTVCKTNDYVFASSFINMVMGAIDD